MIYRTISEIEFLFWIVGTSIIICISFGFIIGHNNRMMVKRAIECEQAYHDAKTAEIIFVNKDLEYILTGVKK